MSENNPITPGGSVPPKPPEAAKVQPKKETVRISLPPKPTSSPTIKLPTMPAGGPAAPGAAAPAAPAGGTPPAPRPPTAGAPGLSVAGAAPAAAAAAPAGRPATNTGAPSARPPGAPAPGPRPAASGGARKISGLDMGLGIAAAVVGIGAIVSLLLLMGLK